MRGAAPLAILVVPLAALSVAMGGATGASVAALVALLIGMLALVMLRSEQVEFRAGPRARREAETRFLVWLVVGGFIVRAALALLLRQLGLNDVLGGDEGTFDANARFFEAYLSGDLPEPFQDKWRDSSQVGYFVIVGTLYWLFGIVQIVPVLINCAIGALTAVPVYRMTARMGGALAGRLAALLVVFFPSLVLWSCLMVRDALAFFLIAWCACIGQDLLRRISIVKLVVLVLCLALLATLRSYIFLLLAGTLVVAFLVSVMRRPGRAFGVALLASLGILALVRGAGLGSEFVGQDYLARVDEQRRLNALVGNAAIDFGRHDISTPTGALTYLPVGLLYFLLAPFPWQLGGRQAMALPDMLLWYICLPLVIIGGTYAMRYRRTLGIVPLLSAISISMLYALVEGNVGIIVRHRAQVLVLFLPFAGLAAARLYRAWARRRAAELARLARVREATAWRVAGTT